MNFHSYGDSPSKSVIIITGPSVLIDPSSRPKGTCLEVESGIARVYCPCEETEGMTLAFLQSGDQLRTSELLIAPIGTQTVSVAPSFIETSPL